MTIPESIVPSFPYEGGLYWLIGEATVRHSLSHPYYRVLYGPNPDQVAVRAGALACLFDRIELAGADHGLPDAQRYYKDRAYYHPHLRLSMSWDDSDWNAESRELARYLCGRRQLRSLLEAHPLFARNEDAQVHFLTRIISQVRLAIRRNAVIVGDDFFQSVYRLVAPSIKQFVDDTPGSLPEGIALALNEETLAITSLDFAPSNFDGFAAVRMSSEVSEYASAFRDAIGKARDSGDLEASLLRLMKEAMESERITNFATKALQTTGSVMNVVGLIPLVGTAASIGSIATDISTLIAEAKAKERRWYLVGPKMKEIELKEILHRK